MTQGFNITISIPSGNPEKLRLIEKTNRLSLGLVFNRDELADLARERKELGYTGIYLLVNTNTNTLPEIYIGEGESVISRLQSHSKDSKKDFWEWTVVFVNRDNSLHKAHIQHIESSLVDRAVLNKRCIVKNDVMPQKTSLPEPVLFESEDMLNDIYHIVPLLGISAFELILDDENSGASTPLFVKTKGIVAEGFQSGGKFTVKRNSQANKESTPSISSGFRSLRMTLVEQGVLVAKDNHLSFSQDYTFQSPSTAATVVMGRSANGRIEWRAKSGETLKKLQEALMD